MVAAERLRQVFAYDQDTGAFTCLIGRQGKSAGAIAGSIDTSGYRRIAIDGKRYQAHRLAWLYVHGTWPKNDVDHVNGDRADNRIANLREATRSENIRNSRISSSNTSGLKGVSWSKASKRWRSSINVNGKLHYLGLFDSADEAHDAYTEAAKKHHGEFANSGSKIPVVKRTLYVCTE